MKSKQRGLISVGVGVFMSFVAAWIASHPVTCGDMKPNPCKADEQPYVMQPYYAAP